MKLFKRVFIVILVLMLLPMLLPNVSWSHNNDNILLAAAKKAGLSLELMEIADWSIINRDFMEFTDMEKKRDHLLTFFDVKKENLNSTKESNEKYRILITEGKINSDTFLQIVLQTVVLPEEFEKAPQTYLLINISSRDYENCGALEGLVKKAMAACGGESKITTCITGSINGKLDDGKQDKIIEKILMELKAKEVKKVHDEYTKSMIANSPLIEGDIEIVDKSFNVNIATRYNYEDDKTYFWVGTPVISSDY